MAEWSKDVFARNLTKYMERSGKNQKELAEIVGVSAPTVHDWIHGKKYPRIDKIEIMADYFGILKSDLIEEKTPEREEMEKKAGTVADAVLRMKNDPDFFSIINLLLVLDQERLKDVLDLLTVFLK